MKLRLEFMLVALTVLAACSPAATPTKVTNPPAPSPPTSPTNPPLTPVPPGPPVLTFQQQTLDRINAARAQARSCGAERFAPAPSLVWNKQLVAAADAHTRDMIAKNFFAHIGSDGGNVGTRSTKAGYAWGAVGENIAAGYASLDGVMRGWLESPGHCANLMNPNFTEVGVVTRSSKGTKYTSYWTMVLARPK
jgi:uncharacterized protein YkwD